MDTGAEYPEPFLETEENRWRIMQCQQYEVAHTGTLLETTSTHVLTTVQTCAATLFTQLSKRGKN